MPEDPRRDEREREERREHPGPERLSVLLDEPGADEEARVHLEGCAACRAEYERLSRIRMALSGMGELEPPAEEWEEVVARLEAEGIGARASRSGAAAWRARLSGRWPVQAAAAAAILFAGGLFAGLRLGDTLVPGVPVEGVGIVTQGAERAGSGSARAEAEPEPLLDALLALADPGSAGAEEAAAGEEPALDFALAAERLVRLEALIRASREAVSEAPADPLASGLLLRLVEERESLASRLDRQLRLAAMEYR